ncbi:response regulator [Mesorhizobium sp. M0053]|uniref:response regulator n=1 Tax=Mesorhizobium sp. M0053 TaxID=2956864 RepID=UPI003337D5AE
MILLDIENSLREAGFEVIAVLKGLEAIATFDREPERVAALLTRYQTWRRPYRVGCGPAPPSRQSYHASDIHEWRLIYMSGDGADDWPSLGVPNSLMITKPFVMPQIITGLATLLNQKGVDQLPASE